MTIQELFVVSNAALKKSISQIKQDQWGIMMPPGLSSKPSTLVDAVRYHTYDDAWVPDVLAGKTKQEVGDVFEPLLKSENIVDNYNKYNQIASDSVTGFTDLDKMTHLSYGDFTAKDYLQHIISFRAFRSYDIAKMIGADTVMNDAFIQAIIDEFSPVIDDYRKMGIFPPALPILDNADLQTKMLAMFGRK